MLFVYRRRAVKTARSAMLFFQVLPFTDMKKRDGFWCEKVLTHLRCLNYMVFMQIRCNFPDISYLSETQKNTFQFLKEKHATTTRRFSVCQDLYCTADTWGCDFSCPPWSCLPVKNNSNYIYVCQLLKFSYLDFVSAIFALPE